MRNSKTKLDNLQTKLELTLDKIEKDIDENKKLSKDDFRELKKLIKNITQSQEEYVEKFGKTNQFKVTR